MINVIHSITSKVVDRLHWKDKIPLPAREDSASEAAGWMASMS
jgi:hypothetical protein